jgi:pimeloyl-ACP methyl ester carboxylesterase
MAKSGKIIKTIIAIIVVLVTVAGTVAGASFYLYKNKKTIIILPGLMASALYDTETGNGVWDPFYDIDLHFSTFINDEGINLGSILPLIAKQSIRDELAKLFDNDFHGAPDSLMNLIAMNEDGSPKNPNVQPVPWENETRLRYGVINAQTEMQKAYEEAYGKEYVVQVFNYDFRIDNRVSAARLEEFINKKGYDEVILVAHSNGGQVASCYLAKEENRKKVSKYISYSVPYFGSFSAITQLENIDNMLNALIGSLGEGSLADNLEQVFQNQFLSLLYMWAPYQLLPTFDYINADNIGGKAEIIVDGEPLSFANEEELHEFYCSRPWAKMSNGELRPAMVQWLDYVNAIKVTLPNGEKVLSPTLVDTTYINGVGVETLIKVYYDSDGEGGLVLTDEEVKSTYGDGTVSYYTAIGGENDASKIRLMEGVNHYGVNGFFVASVQEDSFEVMDAYLESRSAKWYDLAGRLLSSIIE